MTIPRCDRNLLLVEGVEEKFLIPELIEQALRIEWGDRRRKQHPVEIKMRGGIELLLDRDFILNVLRIPALEALGVVVDADGNVAARWQQIRARFVDSFPELPPQLPTDGLVLSNQSGMRLGVWIMPDNRSVGMLETLLVQLIPDKQQPLLLHANESIAGARTKGAMFKDAHLDKARVHTWLAWQDPPGLQLHEAVVHRVLRPDNPLAQPFVQWFASLYGLG